MQTYNGLFEVELRKLIDQAIAHTSEALVSGMMSLEDYRRTGGIVAGLKLCHELCDEANTIMAKR